MLCMRDQKRYQFFRTLVIGRAASAVFSPFENGTDGTEMKLFEARFAWALLSGCMQPTGGQRRKRTSRSHGYGRSLLLTLAPRHPVPGETERAETRREGYWDGTDDSSGVGTLGGRTTSFAFDLDAPTQPSSSGRLEEACHSVASEIGTAVATPTFVATTAELG